MHNLLISRDSCFHSSSRTSLVQSSVLFLLVKVDICNHTCRAKYVYIYSMFGKLMMAKVGNMADDLII